MGVANRGEAELSQKARSRIGELERVVSAQNEQVKFLAEQLQRIMGPNQILKNPSTAKVELANIVPDKMHESSDPDEGYGFESSGESDEGLTASMTMALTVES